MTVDDTIPSSFRLAVCTPERLLLFPILFSLLSSRLRTGAATASYLFLVYFREVGARSVNVINTHITRRNQRNTQGFGS